MADTNTPPPDAKEEVFLDENGQVPLHTHIIPPRRAWQAWRAWRPAAAPRARAVALALALARGRRERGKAGVVT
jgi:hypothetical protein